MASQRSELSGSTAHHGCPGGATGPDRALASSRLARERSCLALTGHLLGSLRVGTMAPDPQV